MVVGGVAAWRQALCAHRIVGRARRV